MTAPGDVDRTSSLNNNRDKRQAVDELDNIAEDTTSSADDEDDELQTIIKGINVHGE